MDDIAHRTELYLCQKLTALVPGVAFVPETGPDENSTTATVEPPYCLIIAKKAENMIAGMDVYQIEGAARPVFQSSETNPAAQSQTRKAIRDALGFIAVQDADIVDGTFAFSGLDITGVASETDDSKKARVGDINWAAGVSG